jgi:hypothetical protein
MGINGHKWHKKKAKKANGKANAKSKWGQTPIK